MAHWKTLFDYEHLGSHDLPRDAELKPLDIVVSITKLEKRDVKGKGGAVKPLAVADLKGAKKPWIVNKTNLDALATLFDTTEYELYLNRPFTLYAAKVKGVEGKIVDGLRIRGTAPQTKAKVKTELTPEHPKWSGALKSMKAGDITIERLRGSFSISEANEKLLTT